MARGPVEERVLVVGGRLTVTIRGVVGGASASLGVVVATDVTVAVLVAAGVVLWHGLLVGAVWSDRRRYLAVLDAIALAGVCFLQFHLLPPEFWFRGDGWVVATTSTAVILAQGYLRPGAGVAFGLCVALSFWVAAVTSGAGDRAVPHAFWLLAETAMGVVMMAVVVRGARRADVETVAVAAAEYEVDVARARREDARHQSALLHDTVAATLTAASAHAMDERARTLVAEQALRDIRLLERGDLDLDSPLEGHGNGVDLTLPDRLHAVAEASGLTVDLTTPRELPVIPDTAIAALAAATREALVNTSRHSGVGAASVVVAACPSGGVTVTVRDEGCGFDMTSIGEHRKGISLSIAGRMRRTGGEARVMSAVEEGTTVMLAWPRREGAG